MVDKNKNYVGLEKNLNVLFLSCEYGAPYFGIEEKYNYLIQNLSGNINPNFLCSSFNSSDAINIYSLTDLVSSDFLKNPNLEKQVIYELDSYAEFLNPNLIPNILKTCELDTLVVPLNLDFANSGIKLDSLLSQLSGDIILPNCDKFNISSSKKLIRYSLGNFEQAVADLRVCNL